MYIAVCNLGLQAEQGCVCCRVGFSMPSLAQLLVVCHSVLVRVGVLIVHLSVYAVCCVVCCHVQLAQLCNSVSDAVTLWQGPSSLFYTLPSTKQLLWGAFI